MLMSCSEREKSSGTNDANDADGAPPIKREKNENTDDEWKPVFELKLPAKSAAAGDGNRSFPDRFKSDPSTLITATENDASRTCGQSEAANGLIANATDASSIMASSSIDAVMNEPASPAISAHATESSRFLASSYSASSDTEIDSAYIWAQAVASENVQRNPGQPSQNNGTSTELADLSGSVCTIACGNASFIVQNVVSDVASMSNDCTIAESTSGTRSSDSIFSQLSFSGDESDCSLHQSDSDDGASEAELSEDPQRKRGHLKRSNELASKLTGLPGPFRTIASGDTPFIVRNVVSDVTSMSNDCTMAEPTSGARSSYSQSSLSSSASSCFEEGIFLHPLGPPSSKTNGKTQKNRDRPKLRATGAMNRAANIRAVPKNTYIWAQAVASAYFASADTEIDSAYIWAQAVASENAQRNPGRPSENNGTSTELADLPGSVCTIACGVRNVVSDVTSMSNDCTMAEPKCGAYSSDSDSSQSSFSGDESDCSLHQSDSDDGASEADLSEDPQRKRGHLKRSNELASKLTGLPGPFRTIACGDTPFIVRNVVSDVTSMSNDCTMAEPTSGARSSYSQSSLSSSAPSCSGKGILLHPLSPPSSKLNEKSQKNRGLPKMRANGAMNKAANIGAVPKNTNRNIYYANLKYQRRCVLCKKNGPLMHHHYARDHDEVYVSRISSSVQEKHTKNAPRTMSVSGRGHCVFCLFCEQMLSLQKESWIRHMTRHTGEYRYRCRQCNQKNACCSATCQYRQSMEIIDFLLESDALFGYMCNLCSFTQLSKENVRLHIRTQHDRSDLADTAEYCIKYKLIQFEDAPSIRPLVDKSKHVTPARNVDRELYLTNPNCPRICVLCNSNVQKHHYSRMHPTEENFLSRLSPKMMQKGMKGSVKATNTRIGYKAFCLFCEKMWDQRKDHWLRHLAAHTTECMFQCGGCGKFRPESSSKCCLGRKMIRFRSFPYQNGVSGFACTLCNFVQLSQDNIIRHIRIQHEINESAIEANYCPLKFVTFDEESNGSSPKRGPDGHLPLAEMADPDPAEENDSAANSSCSSEASTLPLYLEVNRQEMVPAVPQSSPPRTSAERPIQLMTSRPWISNDTKATSMLDDVCLFAFFKCMGAGCVFSCQSAQRMREHLEIHMWQCRDSPSEHMGHLECAYCGESFKSCENLMEHLLATHANSHFQCQYCFYRSADAYGVLWHQTAYHIGKDQVILLCGGYHRRVYMSQIMELERMHRENVAPISICDDVKVKYYDIKQFILHLKMAHSTALNEIKCPKCDAVVNYLNAKQHLLLHGIGEFQCLYGCTFVTNDLTGFSNHLNNRHPDKLMLIAVRHLRSDFSLTEHRRGDCTIVLNLAGPIDTGKVRIREMELDDDVLDSVDIMPNMSLIADHMRNKNSGLEISKYAESVLESYTIQISESPIIMLNDFRRIYLDEAVSN